MKHSIGSLLVFLFLSQISSAQIITTIAGNGVSGFSGDGGLATAAQLALPASVALDSKHDLYIADYTNGRIRKIDTSGAITTFAGGLSQPYDVITDSVDNLYIANMGVNRICKVDTSGIVQLIAGVGAPGFGGDGAAATAANLNQPAAVAIDRSGNLYIADMYNNRVRKINTSGIISTIAGGGTGGLGDGGPATSASLNWPDGVAVDNAGNIYISDYNNGRIRKVDTAGIITTIAGGGSLILTSADGGPATAALIGVPLKVRLDRLGNIYFPQGSGVPLVRKINNAGIITSIAGNTVMGYSGDGGPATAASVQAYGLEPDTFGNVYIADYSNNRIRKITGSIGTPTGFSIKEPVDYRFSVWPNPSSGELSVFVSSALSESISITITNVVGEHIAEIKSSTNSEIKVHLRVPGVYYISANGSAASILTVVR